MGEREWVKNKTRDDAFHRFPIPHSPFPVQCQDTRSNKAPYHIGPDRPDPDSSVHNPRISIRGPPAHRPLLKEAIDLTWKVDRNASVRTNLRRAET
jgi:hypothetical protein